MQSRSPLGRWELTGTLPALGPAHPLRRNADRTLVRAVAITFALYLVGPISVLLHERSEERPAPPRVPPVRREVELNPPPALDPDRAAYAAPSPSVEAAGIGVQDPVPDFVADFATVVSWKDLVNSLPPPAQADFDPSRDTIAVKLDSAGDRSAPAVFVPVEVQPALVRLPARVYPEIARLAGVEATVLIRVLVGPGARCWTPASSRGMSC